MDPPLAPQTGPSVRKRPKQKNVFSLKSFGHSLNESPAPPVARAGNLTADGRCANVQSIPLDSEHHPSSASRLLLQDDDWLDMESSADLDTRDNATTAQVRGLRKRKRYAATVHFLPLHLGQSDHPISSLGQHPPILGHQFSRCVPASASLSRGSHGTGWRVFLRWASAVPVYGVSWRSHALSRVYGGRTSTTTFVPY
jgi:hypothetical protein